MKRNRILAALLAIIILAAAASYFIFYYVPLPTTKRNSYNCTSTATNSSNSTLEFSVNGVDINLTVEPAVSQFTLGSCTYKTTSINTPIRCGTMCGGGLGSINYYSDVLEFSLSMIGITNNLNYSVVLRSQQTPLLSSLFLPYRAQVYVNSQLASWNSTPACVSGHGYQPNCVVDNYSIMTVSFPASAAIADQNNSVFGLMINSSETLVP